MIENFHVPRLGLLGHALTDRTYFESVLKPWMISFRH